MSKLRFAVVVIIITGFFFACGGLTQDPTNPIAVIVAGGMCALIPLFMFGVGWLAWRNNWTLGID
mgnify:CR=1 FL=1